MECKKIVVQFLLYYILFMGLTIEKSLEITLQKAKELFPNEKWIQDDSLIFHAENRMPKNKQQKLVFEKGAFYTIDISDLK